MATKTVTDSKKNMVLNCVRLGMDKYRVYLLLELNDAQVESLEDNEGFQSQVKATEAILEKDLLEKYHDIIEKSVMKGNPQAIQWLLSKIAPERWGNKVDVSGQGNFEKVSIYLPENGRQ